jgi:hypothetical protein
MKLFQPLHLLVLLIPLVGALATLFWVWMIIECVRRDDFEEKLRLPWLIAIVLTYVFGAFAYLCWTRFFAGAGQGRRGEPEVSS